jgi:xanthine dehydrogenase accessory factor
MERLNPTESSFVVIVTRGHHDDMRVLRCAVQTKARYIGMVGSKRKAITVYGALLEEGLKPELFDRVYSPVGLDIGANLPEEIAVSILAEIIAIRRGAERVLPHMSWFQSGRHRAANEPGKAAPGQGEAGCDEATTVG